MKINSICQFGDSLDFDKILKSTDSFRLSQHQGLNQESSVKNLYHLHGILCHYGTLNRGHYFSFLRVGEKSGDQAEFDGFDDGQWIRFNDTCVVPTFKHVAISTGQGGYNTSYKCEFEKSDQDNDKKVKSPFADLYETRKTSNTQAYMLVYLRDGLRDSILEEPKFDEIPNELQAVLNSENALLDDMIREKSVFDECGEVFLLSQEIM